MKKEMEIWRKFISETLESEVINKIDNNILLESVQSQKTYIYLFEGKDRTPKRVCFEELVKNSKDQDKLYNLWEQSFEYEYQQLLSEGLMDVIASAYESTKAGAIKLKDNISDAALAAIEKVNDFFLEKSIQIVNFVKKGGATVASKVSSLLGGAAKFKEKHPILYKIVVVVGTTAIVYAVIHIVEQALGGGQASAAIKPYLAHAGGLPAAGDAGGIHEHAYEALRGAINTNLPKDAMGGLDLELQHKALEIIDKAQESKDLVDITKIKGPVGEYIKQAFAEINSAYQLAKDTGDPAFKDYLHELYKIGYTLVSKTHDGFEYVATRVPHEKGSIPTFK